MTELDFDELRRHRMNQQTERAREDKSTPLARMKIFAAETNDYMIRAERIRPEIQALLEALTPQPSEEVVEAVARALCNRGHTIDRYSYALPEIKDYWRRQAEAAIAAMPSIPQDETTKDWWKPDPEDPFWMLEADDGEWLKNEHSLLGTRDATKALRFPTADSTHACRRRLFGNKAKWWSAKPTEHLWTNFSTIPQESDAEVTEAMREAGANHIGGGSTFDREERLEMAEAIYTAMTSARDRESQERGK